MVIVSWKDFKSYAYYDHPLDLESRSDRVINAKALYASLLAKIKSPTWELLQFLEREVDNFETVYSDKGSYTTVHKEILINWKKGGFPAGLELKRVSIYHAGVCVREECLGFEWANEEEKRLLATAIINIIKYCQVKEQQAKDLLKQEEAEKQRIVIREWLETHE